MPSEFVEKLWSTDRVIGNHWRALKVGTVLRQLTQNVIHLKTLQNLTDDKTSCGAVTNCTDGIFHGMHCDSGGNLAQCSIMLAGYPGLRHTCKSEFQNNGTKNHTVSLTVDFTFTCKAD